MWNIVMHTPKLYVVVQRRVITPAILLVAVDQAVRAEPTTEKETRQPHERSR